MAIRNFVYLDPQKLRSISSQIFEGFAERVISNYEKVKSDEERQSGPLGSGRILADIFTESNSTSEQRFLDDFAYTLLESRLIESGMLVSPAELNGKTDVGRFIKVTGRMQFNDLAASSRMLRDFNQFGEAMWRVTNESMQANGKNLTPDNEVKKKASQAGLALNKKVSDSAAFLIEFGFGEMFEVSVRTQSVLFSAPLVRCHLRETPDLLVKKYSRSSQSEFSLIGVITQIGAPDAEEQTIPDVADGGNLKDAMRNLSFHLNVVEQAFAGPTKGEVVIDPLAIFSDLGD